MAIPREPEPRPEFAEALRRLAPPAPRVPAELDAAILAAARHPRPSRRPRLPVARWLVPLAAAAALVLWLLPSAMAGDLDGDRRVDIVDAYLLAVQVERGAADRRFDLNRDGDVDRRDVERLAGLAVRLR